MSGAVASGTWEGAFYGAFTGLAFHNIGQTIGASTWAQGDFLGDYSAAGLAAKTVSHGITGGAITHMQGGRFGHGFLSSGVTAASSPYIATKFAGNRYAQGAAAAIVGGTVSSATGGKFANGAVTAAMAFAFNQISQDFLRRNAKQIETLYSESGEGFSDFAGRVSDRIISHTEETRFEYSAAFAQRELDVDGEIQVQYGAIIETQSSHLFSASTRIPKGFSPIRNSLGGVLTIHSHGISEGQRANQFDLKFRPELMMGTKITPVIPPQDRFNFSEFDGPGALATPAGIKWWPGEGP